MPTLSYIGFATILSTAHALHDLPASLFLRCMDELPAFTVRHTGLCAGLPHRTQTIDLSQKCYNTRSKKRTIHCKTYFHMTSYLLLCKYLPSFFIFLCRCHLHKNPFILNLYMRDPITELLPESRHTGTSDGSFRHLCALFNLLFQFFADISCACLTGTDQVAKHTSIYCTKQFCLTLLHHYQYIRLKKRKTNISDKNTFACIR